MASDWAKLCGNMGVERRFAKGVCGPTKKKFILEHVDNWMIEKKLSEKTKKIFGGLKNGRIFASAFLGKNSVEKNMPEKQENVEIFWNMR